MSFPKDNGEPTSTSKPQSPMAVSKSKQEKQENNKLFNVKFKVEDISNLSMFTRACSFRRPNNTTDDSSSSSSSRRFSKGVIQKYLKFIKPFYIEVSKAKNEKMKFSGQLKDGSPTSSPATLLVHSPTKERKTSEGFWVMNRHLSRSKSASATVSSPARRDESLLLQHDGIQSAILHCKKSFNPSRDSSSFSDASVFPRFSIDSPG